MTSRSLPKVLHSKKLNSLEAERENFEKNQAVSINKAINQQEIPLKEKHVRSVIIGSFSDKGARYFYSIATRLPLQGNPIICWKFCHVVHKILREGHQRVISDSQKFRKTFIDLGKLWGHLKEGYGKLILHYTKLLVVKLDFHRRNPRFPGSLQVTDEQLEEIGEREVNNYFQMAVEMFDYMDEILALQSAVFGSLDMSRSNSMTSTGQCRLAPLIPCIQDSSHLYDFCVKLLFRMHSSLPPDLLAGHRDRFFKQFKSLQQFYISSSNLQYFKYLIQIPLLPENAPNFFIASNLSSHVSPVVILPPQAETPDRDGDSVDMSLVDTSNALSTSPNKFEETFGGSSMGDFNFEERNGAASPDERDRLIEELRQEIITLKMEIHRMKIENHRMQEDMKNRIESLQEALSEAQSELEAKYEENNEIRRNLSSALQNTEAVIKLDELEKKSKTNEEKFTKMKDIYTKLREEHITLLRNKADVDKQLLIVQKTEKDSEQARQSIEERLHHLEAEKSKAEEKIQQSADVSDQLQNVTQEKLQLQRIHEDLLPKLTEAQNQNKCLESEIEGLRREKDDLQIKLLDTESKSKEILERERSGSTAKQNEILAAVLGEAISVVQGAMNDFDDPLFATNTCTPEFFIQHAEPVQGSLQQVSDGYKKYANDPSDLECLLSSVTIFSHQLSQFILQGKSTSNMSPDIELGDALAVQCKNLGSETLNALSAIKNKETKQKIEISLGNVDSVIKNILEQMVTLVPKMSNDGVDNIGVVVEDEMSSMDKAIEEAAKHIAEMLDKSRQADSGVKLEVNGKILDACTGLMQAIKILVTSSKHLQAEIVGQGRGTASAVEFYKRNSRWTEGLLSAAKVVGIGAKFLVDAADKVVSGKGKFDELVVASQEIAAGTAQLVIASRVKADRDSKALAKLSSASKNVTAATGNVVATAKSCAELVEDSETMDFTKLSLHQAKRCEMESQVRVLELESLLQKERTKLSSFRRHHYQLAGPSEGWEDQNNAS